MNNIHNLKEEKNWTDDQKVLNFLADRLQEGNLMIFLGAGVSNFYGMPDWANLLENITNNGKKHSIAFQGHSFPSWAEEIQHELFPDDKPAFNAAIHSALYPDEQFENFDLYKIADNKTLRSIGALCHGSRRGFVQKIITLNYDCLLEAYFKFHGVDFQEIYEETFAEKRADVTIYHPHGYLPHANISNIKSENIVITRDDYEQASSSRWEDSLHTLLRTHFTLFIGLSGADDRVSNLISKSKECNPYITNHELPYCGYRIASEDAPMKQQWERRGVYCKEVKNLSDEIPKFLFEICRVAADRL